MSNDDPIRLLALWLEEARAAGVAQADAMCLATASAEGAPSARMVLVRGLDEGELRFYTNRLSRKGRELEVNPRVALVFHWDPLGRQGRVEGVAAPIADVESDAYFASRPRASQLGAWASEQSAPIPSRDYLMERYGELAQRYDGLQVPRPPHWVGYRVEPQAVELWEHGAHRLHDRHRYTRTDEGWVVERLAP
jgi:pyridoxamine 5'-phosphate oxidase